MTKEVFDLINHSPKSEVEDGFEFIFNNCSIDEIPILSRLIDSIENNDGQIDLSNEYTDTRKDYINGITIIKFFK